MANVGPLELGVVLIIVLVVFGPKRLPELGRSLGRGMREFKSSLDGEEYGDRESQEPATLASPPRAETTEAMQPPTADK